jgi:hypothetical protein
MILYSLIVDVRVLRLRRDSGGAIDKKNLSLVRLAERLREIVCDYLSPVDKCAAPLRGRISSTARLNFTVKAPLEPRACGRQNGPVGERFGQVVAERVGGRSHVMSRGVQGRGHPRHAI